MKPNKIILLLLFSCCTVHMYSQESNDYIEFNDRNNVVHGVYIGLAPHLGEIDGKASYLWHLKFAYVANQKFEVGFSAVAFYSQQNLNINSVKNHDLVGGYGGLHFEPILFSKSKFNLSFPLLIGIGAAGFIDGNINHNDIEEIEYSAHVDALFVAEPGINMLYNISRYLQLEVGVKYRFTSDIQLNPSELNNLNGFSVGIGIKMGIFNMGRNRYKKNISTNE